jgi:hypothetical protein
MLRLPRLLAVVHLRRRLVNDCTHSTEEFVDSLRRRLLGTRVLLRPFDKLGKRRRHQRTRTSKRHLAPRETECLPAISFLLASRPGTSRRAQRSRMPTPVGQSAPGLSLYRSAGTIPGLAAGTEACVAHTPNQEKKPLTSSQERIARHFHPCNAYCASRRAAASRSLSRIGLPAMVARPCGQISPERPRPARR